jgi:hypothetical protein
VLAKMARGSGKRSRLHRGFSKGQVAFTSQRQSLRRGLRVLGLRRQQPGRAIAWFRCALCRVSKVKAAHVQHLPPIALQATDGRHAASDSRKPAGESGFCGLRVKVARFRRIGPPGVEARRPCTTAWCDQISTPAENQLRFTVPSTDTVLLRFFWCRRIGMMPTDHPLPERRGNHARQPTNDREQA